MSRSMTMQEAIELGMKHHSAGQLQQAEQIYLQILKHSPNQSDALHLLGLLAQQVGRLELAAELVGRAVAVIPDSAVFHSNLGEIFRQLGRLDDAEAAARRAIELAPALSAPWANLGVVLHAKKQSDQAEAALRRAIEIEPDLDVALSTLGNVLKNRGDLDGAVEMGRRAVKAGPKNPLAHNNLATALELKDELSEAEIEYRKAVELQPTLATALHNVGNIRRKLGDLTDAMKWWNRAIAAQPNHADAHWDLGLGYLMLGDYARGWPLYEWRFQCAQTRALLREYPQPRWNGFDLKDKSMLLYPEQGFGDVIQFARFIPQLAERSARVILQLPAELVELMKGVEGVAQIFGPDEPLPPFDTHQALLSLPWIIGITLENLPAQVPYIGVDPARVDHFADLIQAEPGTRKIGLVFSGRPNPDPKRSCRFSGLAPLMNVPNTKYFSLQVGEAAKELKDSPAIDLNGHIQDFADTAAAIMNLDLLISIDTAAAHLAGALGKPVWTMLPLISDYRWMLDRTDSPWYPTMRLFRQTRAGDWSDVIDAVRGELLNS